MLKIPPISIAKDILNELAVLECPQRSDVSKAVRKRLKGTNYAFPTAIQYWEAYRELGLKNEALEKVLRVKDIRTDSGVAPITVLTKPFPCPGRCVYCPTEARMPKSYLSNEPAAARALSLQFDPYEQVRQRIQALERNGHQANKIELIIKGGTWSAYTKDYREWFITRCFEAANELPAPSDKGRFPDNPPSSLTRLPTPGNGGQVRENAYKLESAQKINETADYRIIGLTIETRPDWITPKEVIHLRKLGCTRVELGIQILNDRVLAYTKRGHTVQQAAEAIALLKVAGFKVDAHILPGQPGASTQDDLDSFALLFSDPRFCPDMIKLYPCVVLPNSELASWAERGEFKPLEGHDLQELLIKMQTMIPKYCRVSRMIRDFPTTSIAFGNKQSNLRELLDAEMKNRGIRCQCLRCREVGHVPGDHTNDKTQVFEERYENAGGTEVFLSVENEDRSAVFGFCRLRLPKIPLNTDNTPSPHDKGETKGVFLNTRPFLYYNPDLTEKARELRKNPTPMEKVFWQKLASNKRLEDLKFNRQKPIDNYIVDFYCSELLLAIEIDGDSHDLQKDYDDARTKKLNELGIQVVRYANRDVINNLEGVFLDLTEVICARKAFLDNPPSSLIRENVDLVFKAFPVLRGAAIIRELHTYGTALNINQYNQDASQHKGYGRLLMQTAEDIAKREGYEKMAVISGIGVREYYKTLGYEVQDTYMLKKLTTDNLSPLKAGSRPQAGQE